MGTSARLICPAALLLLEVGLCSAAIVPITGVNAGVNGESPYLLESIAVGDFTITKEFLALGTSSGDAYLFSDIRYADDFNLNSVASRDASGVWQVMKIGGLDAYSDTNGNAPDFFLFEAGMNDAVEVQAILADGTLGQAVEIPTSAWGYVGLDKEGIMNGGQPIGGVAFAITDLLDADGAPLAAHAAIRGLQFNSENVDPVHFSAAMMVPEPATLAILGLGGLFILRRRW